MELETLSRIRKEATVAVVLGNEMLQSQSEEVLAILNRFPSSGQ